MKIVTLSARVTVDKVNTRDQKNQHPSHPYKYSLCILTFSLLSHIAVKRFIFYHLFLFFSALSIFFTVDGSWTAWSSWSSCPVTCGIGNIQRQRTCTDPSPQYNGADCAGNTTDTSTCNLPSCISMYIISAQTF